MSTIKKEVVDIFSSVEAKGNMSGQQLQEEIDHRWHVSNSTGINEQLKKIFTDDMKESFESVRV